MAEKKTTFALFFGNRGFFPASLMDQARQDLPKALKKLGYDSIMMPADATRHGAVETPAEGALYAEFLRKNAGKFDGVILSLPNFGDETGAVAALKDAGVPILIQAFPDDLDKMAPAVRRDSFCGKFSIMDVFCQSNVKFTALKPHTVAPDSPDFAANADYFARVCRVVKGVKNMVVGAIGARTSAFKTVRIDELTLQKYGITMETFDLSYVFDRMRQVKEKAAKDKLKHLKSLADWSTVPAAAQDKLSRLGVVLDQLTQEYKLDALAVRCWLEMQQQLKISPCILLGDMNQRGIACACEVDVGNAIAMHALKLACGKPAACLDWNNNYAQQDDKCILFHCGPVPMSMMCAGGKVTEHAILANAVGKNCSWGCNVGRIAPTPFTFASLTTMNGRINMYTGQGQFTDDPIPSEFFGCAGVAQIPDLQDVLLYVGRNGHRHHVSVSSGHVAEPVADALGYYLGFDVCIPQKK